MTLNKTGGEKDNPSTEEIMKIINEIYFFVSFVLPNVGMGRSLGPGFPLRVCLEKEELMVRAGTQGGEILLQVPEGFLQLLPLCP